MLSAEDTAMVKIAIEICNNPELKREILCVSGSDYDVNKNSDMYNRAEEWKEIVEKKAGVILRHLGSPEKLKEKVIGILTLIGMRMLTWAEYHEGTIGFLREYSSNFLNSTLFTQRGIIDNEKAAEELMKDKSLSIKQKYKLACLYCFTDHIPALYKQMTREDKGKFYSAHEPQEIKQIGLVKFWSYYLMGEIDKLRGQNSLHQYRLEIAVESGSKAAVEYCFEKTNSSRKKGAIIDAAIETVRNRAKRRPHAIGTNFENITDDWVVFGEQRYDGERSWIPSDYYVDILCCLFSRMRADQQEEFLKRDIEDVNYEKGPFGNPRHSRVLEYFLDWPYQDYFMKTAKLMWEFLPERSFADLLLEICHKIESENRTLKYGEGKTFDYKHLLRMFWCDSPERFKRYVLNDSQISSKNGDTCILKVGKELLLKLFTLNSFASEDRKNIELIVASATDKEKENIINSEDGELICILLTEVEKWEILDWFVLICSSSREQADKFKRNFSFTKAAQNICIDFVKIDNWFAAESFIRWSTLPEDEVICLKKKMIYSEDGIRACRDLGLHKESVEVANRILKWCFSSEESIRKFKTELIFSDIGVGGCSSLVMQDKIELLDEFTKWCLSSQEDIKEFKKNFAYRMEDFICEALISDYSEKDTYDEQGCYTIDRLIIFNGGKWEQVEKFLTWCFSSEEDIRDFKKDKLLEMSGVEIHFNLIKSNQWEEAETFFAWLEVSAETIKELKKDTLFDYDAASEMFCELMYSEDGDKRFAQYGSKQEAIELLLRWYLTDKETVLEFKDRFKHQFTEMTEEDEAVLKIFDLFIEEHLRELDKKQWGVKEFSESAACVLA